MFCLLFISLLCFSDYWEYKLIAKTCVKKEGDYLKKVSELKYKKRCKEIIYGNNTILKCSGKTFVLSKSYSECVRNYSFFKRYKKGTWEFIKRWLHDILLQITA